ncbi:hypothetical protein COOONC_19587, partial [Cooperia oncophora]
LAEKLERPLLESLSRQPKLPNPPQHRGESTDEDHQHIRNKRRGGRRKLPKSVNCQLFQKNQPMQIGAYNSYRLYCQHLYKLTPVVFRLLRVSPHCVHHSLQQLVLQIVLFKAIKVFQIFSQL